MHYTSVGNRCPVCRCSFRTLEDEYGTHPCPRCGYYPGTYDEDDGETCEDCGGLCNPCGRRAKVFIVIDSVPCEED